MLLEAMRNACCHVALLIAISPAVGSLFAAEGHADKSSSDDRGNSRDRETAADREPQLLRQARAVFGVLPAKMPGGEDDTQVKASITRTRIGTTWDDSR